MLSLHIQSTQQWATEHKTQPQMYSAAVFMRSIPRDKRFYHVKENDENLITCRIEMQGEHRAIKYTGKHFLALQKAIGFYSDDAKWCRGKQILWKETHQLWLEELQDAFEVFENAANGDLLSKNLGAA